MPEETKNPTTADTSKPAASVATKEFSKAKDAISVGASQLTHEVKETATQAIGEAQTAATSKLDSGRDFAAEHIGSVADALRKTEDELRSSDSVLTDYVGQAATAMDNVSSYLQTRTLSELMGDLEGFARREPAMFLGGAFVAGIFGGRFLKSTTPAPRSYGRKDGASASAEKAQQGYGALPSYAGEGATFTGGTSSAYTTAKSPVPSESAKVTTSTGSTGSTNGKNLSSSTGSSSKVGNA